MEQSKRNRSLGQAGESFAAEWLVNRVFEIHERNYHGSAGEIDIIAYHPVEKYYAMVEVKTRFDRNGINAIDARKVQNMWATAEHYFFKKLGLQYAPEFELRGLSLQATIKNEKLKINVIDWIAL